MEKNISIKVSYQKTNRRFAIAKNAKWSELETSIRTLYSLPPTFSFALTYMDEDSDVITLRSDLELQEILSQPHYSSTLKFTIVPYEIQTQSIESSIDKGIESSISKGIESSISKGIENSISKGIESSISKGIESSIDKDIESNIDKGVESSIIESSIYKGINNNISKDHDISKDNKYNNISKVNNDNDISKVNNNNDISKVNNNNDISKVSNDNNPEIEQLPQYFSLNFPSFETNETNEIVSPSNKGKQKAEYSFEEQCSSNQSEFSPYDEQNHEEEQTSKPPFIDLAAQFQKLIDQFRPLIEQHPRLIEQANNVMDQILHNIPVDLEMWSQWFKDQIADVQRNFRDVTANPSDEETNFFDEIQRFAQNAVQSGQSIAQNAVQSGQLIALNARKLGDRLMYHMTEEELNEKLTALRSMGFRNDKENEELLKKYYGNVEKVVEILLSDRNDVEFIFVDNEVQMEDL